MRGGQDDQDLEGGRDGDGGDASDPWVGPKGEEEGPAALKLTAAGVPGTVP